MGEPRVRWAVRLHGDWWVPCAGTVQVRKAFRALFDSRRDACKEMGNWGRARAEMVEARGSDERDAFLRAKSAEIDALYAEMADRVSAAMYAPTPEGWPEPPPLTRRQRFNIWKWRVRRWLAAPFIAVVRWLAPDELRSEDD